MLKFVKGREGNVDVANMASLGSDLAKEWGDVRTTRGRQSRNKNAGKSKAVVGIQQWAGFAVHLLVGTEECRTEIFPFGEKQGRRRKAMGCYKDDGFGANKEF